MNRNGQALSEEEGKQHQDKMVTPACVKACPADCLRFGTRDDLLKEAHGRIAGHPDRYVDHIYGEKEAGGTSVLYLSSVPFEKIGFPDVGTKAYPSLSSAALHAVPPAVIALGAMLGGLYALLRRKASMIGKHDAGPGPDSHDHHPEFELRPIPNTPNPVAIDL